MAKKLYKSTTGVEYMFHVPVDNKEVTVWTRESGNTFTTSNIALQKAVEEHDYFKKGLIILISEEKSAREGIDDADADITPLRGDDVPPADETKETGNTPPAEKKTEGTEEIKIIQAQNEYPDVKYMNDAVEVLKAPPFNIPEAELVLKKQVLAKAKELGIKFPNYR